MNRNIIAIGGSAGSLDTLLAIIAQFPESYEGSLFVAVHVGRSRSQLPELLTRVGKLPARAPHDSEAIRPGHIYVAPSDRHLLVEPGMVRISRGPREHFTRPAIDPLFRSVAVAYGERVIGVVLSGGGSDGAAGLDRIKHAGGVAVVLDPRDAVAAEMPQAAAAIAQPDYIAAAVDLPPLLVRLSQEAIPDVQIGQASKSVEAIQMPERPLVLTCPECGGALRKTGGGTSAQFRCHIGHLFNGGELAPAQLEQLEKALDVAQRVLNERIELARQMAKDAEAEGRSTGVWYWERVRAEAEQQADAIRQVLVDCTGPEHEAGDASG